MPTISLTPESFRSTGRKLPGILRISLANRILAVLSLMYFVFYVDRVNIATLAPVMTRDLRLSNADFGLAVSAFAYPYALFQLIGGWVGDRLGPQRALMLCGIVVCLATSLTGFVGGLGSLVAARLALGFGEGSAFPTATRAISLWLPRVQWGFAQGITHSAARLGNALTPLLIATLIKGVSWRMTFILVGLLTIVWVVLWISVVPDSHSQTRNDEVTTQSPPSIQNKELESESVNHAVPWTRLALRMLPVTAVDFCYGWALWVSLTWLPSFFFEKFHLDLTRSALFSSCVLLSGVIGDAAGGYVSDRLYERTRSLKVARRNLIVVAMLAGLGFLLPVVMSRDLTTVTLCLSAAFFCSELVVGPIWSVPMDIAPRYAGSASGIMNFGFGMAGIISPIVFGELLDLTGNWTIPFYCTIFLLLCGASLAFLMHPERPFAQNVTSR